MARSTEPLEAPVGDWWRAFFSGMVFDHWRAWVDEAQTRREAQWIHRVLALPRPGRVLDVPCGDGRLSHALADMGHWVTGIDQSETFLSAARSHRPASGPTPSFLRADMRHLPWRAVFDGVVCFGSSWGYFEDDDNQTFLREVAAALRPGGSLLLETNKVLESLLPRWEAVQVVEVGDMAVRIDSELDVASGVLTAQYRFERDGEIERRTMRTRVYACRELAARLRSAGLTPVTWHGDTEGTPYAVGSPRLLLAARRDR